MGPARDQWLLPLVMGLTDGTLNTLILAAGRMATKGPAIGLGLALRIAASSLISGVFVYFVARYADLRAVLVQAERQLNLTSRGKLAASHLGRKATFESVWSAAMASSSAFVGAMVPLAPVLLAPDFRIGPLLAALVTLGLLGVGLARTTQGSMWRWSLALVLGGTLFYWVGMQLRIL